MAKQRKRVFKSNQQTDAMKKVRKPAVRKTKVIKEKNDKGYDRKDKSWKEDIENRK